MADSHSMVAGGLLVISYPTRFTPPTSFAIRLETRASTSAGSVSVDRVLKILAVNGDDQGLSEALRQKHSRVAIGQSDVGMDQIEGRFLIDLCNNILDAAIHPVTRGGEKPSSWEGKIAWIAHSNPVPYSFSWYFTVGPPS